MATVASPSPSEPWSAYTREAARSLHRAWTTEPANIADARRLARACWTACANGDVLDYGCGTGRLAPFFSSPRYGYAGFDRSEAMLAVAREMYPDAAFVSELPCRPVDLVVCNSVVQYQADDTIDAVLDEVCGLARHAVVIETYDGAVPLQRASGYDIPVWIREAPFYMERLARWGPVRRECISGDGDARLVVYVVVTGAR